MTRRIPARYRFRNAHARRHPHRDRNKHRLAWGKCDWKLHNLERAATAVAAAFMQLADGIPTHT